MQVEGDLSGHVFVLFGNLNVSGRVAGAAAVVGGNAVIDGQARIGGRTTVLGGNAVYESDESLSGDAFVLGGHISNLAGRPAIRRRASLTPVSSAAAAVLAVALLGVFLFPRARRRPVRV